MIPRLRSFAQPEARSSSQPLGTSGDQRRRLVRHHVPLAVASAAVLVLFMTLPLFDATGHPDFIGQAMGGLAMASEVLSHNSPSA
ncbi:MAG: hypothetical protein GEU90_19560 [Gemmatimonas sp.]|nr:hypothetical protein [Gemmatimonas sp.]